jgi:hypothetical protein
MSDGDAYARQLVNIESALKRCNESAKNLRNQRLQVKERFYNWMARKELEEYSGYKREKIKPKAKATRKKKDEKRKDAFSLFMEVGIPDPEDFWERFQATQKLVKEEEEEN